MVTRYLPLTAIAALTICCLTSCQSGGPTESAPGTDTTMHQQADATTYDLSLVNNAKDPVCGMPVTAGISDTAHYKNDVLGFCSAECKAEFQKNPESMLTAAEIKKK